MGEGKKGKHKEALSHSPLLPFRKQTGATFAHIHSQRKELKEEGRPYTVHAEKPSGKEGKRGEAQEESRQECVPPSAGQGRLRAG